MNTPSEPDEILNKEKKGKKKEYTLERMRLTLEKLHLARVKVTITFNVLGFAAYKIFFVRNEAGKQPVLDFPNGRDIGIILISIGLLVLLFAAIQHSKSVANLRTQYEKMPYSHSLILSYIVLALSLSLLLILVFRL